MQFAATVEITRSGAAGEVVARKRFVAPESSWDGKDFARLAAELSVAVGAVALSRAGMVRSEAVALAAMLGFVLYLVLLLWGFSVRKVSRLWLGFGAGAAVMWALWRLLA